MVLDLRILASGSWVGILQRSRDWPRWTCTCVAWSAKSELLSTRFRSENWCSPRWLKTAAWANGSGAGRPFRACSSRLAYAWACVDAVRGVTFPLARWTEGPKTVSRWCTVSPPSASRRPSLLSLARALPPRPAIRRQNLIYIFQDFPDAKPGESCDISLSSHEVLGEGFHLRPESTPCTQHNIVASCVIITGCHHNNNVAMLSPYCVGESIAWFTFLRSFTRRRSQLSLFLPSHFAHLLFLPPDISNHSPTIYSLHNISCALTIIDNYCFAVYFFWKFKSSVFFHESWWACADGGN